MSFTEHLWACPERNEVNFIRPAVELGHIQNPVSYVVLYPYSLFISLVYHSVVPYPLFISLVYYSVVR